MNLEELLERAAKTHHMVWMKQDGDDPEWPIWYATWLIDHSDFIEITGTEITKSELTCRLIDLDKRFNKNPEGKGSWQAYYAEKLVSEVA